MVLTIGAPFFSHLNKNQTYFLLSLERAGVKERECLQRKRKCAKREREGAGDELKRATY